MVQDRERRYSKRFNFTDGKVFCEEKTTLKVFKQYSEPCILRDLTKSGVSFETTRVVREGEKVNLKIDIPGKKNIQVKGQVAWISDQSDSEQQAVGVQFLPFGSVKMFNSFSTREKLERLIGEAKPPEEEIQ